MMSLTYGFFWKSLQYKIASNVYCSDYFYRLGRDSRVTGSPSRNPESR